MMRQKDFPKEIEVDDGIFYKIKFKRGLEEKGYCGLCFFDKKEIWISTGLGPELRLETVIHEALHALFFERGKDLDHPTINRLEKPLSFFMRRNAVWIKW